MWAMFSDNSTGHHLECGNSFLHNGEINSNTTERFKRNVSPTTTVPTPPLNTEIYVETAVFVDKDLYAHMSSTFPQNTEKELIKFVLALINAVSSLSRLIWLWDRNYDFVKIIDFYICRCICYTTIRH